MPELPDAEIFRQYLDATSLHQVIKRAVVHDTEVLEDISARSLQRRLKGRRFESTRRHGKYVLVRLDDDTWFILHFGMTGYLEYFKDLAKDPKHDRLLISFAGGFHLAYVCQRRLGRVSWVKDPDKFIKAKGLGPDALAPSLSFEVFKKILVGRKGSIKSVLMNQKLMAGIGNIYADEILFQSGVHPKTRVNQLGERIFKRLYQAMKDILKQAIEGRAAPERLPDSFLLPSRQKGGRCPRCGKKLDQIKVSGRTAFFCSRCQKKPKDPVR